MWTKDLFGTEKPVIALLHLDALPGEPAFCGSLDTVMKHAATDLEALQDGGVDGVLIANEYCFPITPNTGTVTLMAMAAAIGFLKKDIRVPFGTNVVYNPQETIKMAAALGASFTRSAFGGAYTGAYGLHSVNFGDMVRLKFALGHPEIQLLCKFNPEGDARLGNQTMEETMNGLCQGDYAGGLCVSGASAGQEASMKFLEEVTGLARKKNVPVFCNTGCRHDTIEKILQVADGACVGTALKGADGRVDLKKTRAFMAIARRQAAANAGG
jgi:membrane complex biogenesis BtpA family protein